jgi:hypothetical protein
MGCGRITVSKMWPLLKLSFGTLNWFIVSITSGVNNFYNEVKPNPAHFAIADLEEMMGRISSSALKTWIIFWIKQGVNEFFICMESLPR